MVSGDTLIVIAKEKLGITLPALLAANPQVTNPDAIEVGQVLNVPLCGAAGGGGGGRNNTEVGNGNRRTGRRRGLVYNVMR